MWSVKSGDTPGVFHSLSHPHKRKGAGRNRGGYTVTALRFPALLGRQSRRGLEIGSLSRPLAALRRFPLSLARRGSRAQWHGQKCSGQAEPARNGLKIDPHFYEEEKRNGIDDPPRVC